MQILTFQEIAAMILHTSLKFKTQLTEDLKIKYPVVLAGMNGVSNAHLAAAISNAGGLGESNYFFSTCPLENCSVFLSI